MSNEIWQLEEKKATAKLGTWSASIDITNPSDGLLVQGSKLMVRQLFAFLINDEPVDCFERDSDLVLRYPPRNSDLVSYESYYRVTDDPSGLELILSAQTSLLESKPETKITTQFGQSTIVTMPSKSGAGANATYFLVRLHDCPDTSIMMMAHPTDLHRAEVGENQISFWVFPESLEKGVIRRARFQMRLIDRESDEAIAAELFDAINLELPPLAT